MKDKLDFYSWCQCRRVMEVMRDGKKKRKEGNHMAWVIGIGVYLSLCAAIMYSCRFWHK